MDIPDIWTFKSDEVAKNFDNHVREQLPFYDLALSVTAHIAKHYTTTGIVSKRVKADSVEVETEYGETEKGSSQHLKIALDLIAPFRVLSHLFGKSDALRNSNRTGRCHE